jgi:Raf kinase inhibitor-like YbhB/YbcL family protein
MFPALALLLTSFLVAFAYLIGGPTASPQTAIPPTPTMAASGGVSTTSPITMSATASLTHTTGITAAKTISDFVPVTQAGSPSARVAMSVTVGISHSIQIVSPAFPPNGLIPSQYTCVGQGLNPPLTWTGVPSGAKSLAMTLEDPDAPNAARLVVHWVVFNLPPTATGLQAALPADAKLPDGTIQGLSQGGKPGYRPPCPPAGATHRYIFRIYALDTQLDLPDAATRDDLFQATEGHILAWGQVIGLYQRGG